MEYTKGEINLKYIKCYFTLSRFFKMFFKYYHWHSTRRNLHLLCASIWISKQVINELIKKEYPFHSYSLLFPKLRFPTIVTKLWNSKSHSLMIFFALIGHRILSCICKWLAYAIPDSAGLN